MDTKQREKLWKRMQDHNGILCTMQTWEVVELLEDIAALTAERDGYRELCAMLWILSIQNTSGSDMSIALMAVDLRVEGIIKDGDLERKRHEP